MAHGKALELSQLREPTKTPAAVHWTKRTGKARIHRVDVDADGVPRSVFDDVLTRWAEAKPGTVQRKALSRVLASDARREMKGMARRSGGRP